MGVLGLEAQKIGLEQKIILKAHMDQKGIQELGFRLLSEEKEVQVVKDKRKLLIQQLILVYFKLIKMQIKVDPHVELCFHHIKMETQQTILPASMELAKDNKEVQL